MQTKTGPLQSTQLSHFINFILRPNLYLEIKLHIRQCQSELIIPLKPPFPLHSSGAFLSVIQAIVTFVQA